LPEAEELGCSVKDLAGSRDHDASFPRHWHSMPSLPVAISAIQKETGVHL
jgi:hypothetical protein